MIVLVVILVFGLGFAYFATLNTATAIIRFDQYTGLDIPVYLIVLGSLLLGIVIAGILSFVKSISTRLKLHGKEGAIKDAQREIADLTKAVHKLELENAKLKGEDEESSVDTDAL